MTVVAGFFGLTGIYTNATQGVIIDLPSDLSWDGVRNESLVNVVTVFGSAFNDTILGDAADNLIDGGPGGADRLDGGLGRDTLSYLTSFTPVIVDMSAGLTWDGVNNDTIFNFENVIGSSGNDKIFGDAQDNILNGGQGGADLLSGGAGSDTVSYQLSATAVIVDLSITSNPGGTNLSWDGVVNDQLISIENATGSDLNDKFISGNNANVFDGRGGTDTVSYENSTRGVIVDLSITSNPTGANLSWDGAFNDQLISIENATGSNLSDKFISGSNANVFDGGAGTDTVSYENSQATFVSLESNFAGDGDALFNLENVIGSHFSETIIGNAGANVLDGGGGNDEIHGRGGADTLIGGSGNDIFVGDEVGAPQFQDTYRISPIFVGGSGSFGSDTVTNFTEASVFDKIDFHGFGAINSSSILISSDGIGGSNLAVAGFAGNIHVLDMAPATWLPAIDFLFT